MSSWFDDMSDSELIDLIPFLDTLSKVDNVYTVLRNCTNPLNSISPSTGGLTGDSRGPPNSGNGTGNGGGTNINGQMPQSQGPITQVVQPSPKLNASPAGGPFSPPPTLLQQQQQEAQPQNESDGGS